VSPHACSAGVGALRPLARYSLGPSASASVCPFRALVPIAYTKKKPLGNFLGTVTCCIDTNFNQTNRTNKDMSKSTKSTKKATKTDIQSFNIKVDAFGQLSSSINVEALNAFLDETVEDKKLKWRKND
jgi:hypothetical protein